MHGSDPKAHSVSISNLLIIIKESLSICIENSIYAFIYFYLFMLIENYSCKLIFRVECRCYLLEDSDIDPFSWSQTGSKALVYIPWLPQLDQADIPLQCRLLPYQQQGIRRHKLVRPLCSDDDTWETPWQTSSRLTK